MASSVITIAQPPSIPGGPQTSATQEMHVASTRHDESENSDFTLFSMSEEEDAKSHDDHEPSPEKTRKDRESSFEKLEGLNMTKIPSTSKDSRLKAELKRKQKRRSRAPEARIELKEEKVAAFFYIFDPKPRLDRFAPGIDVP